MKTLNTTERNRIAGGMSEEELACRKEMAELFGEEEFQQMLGQDGGNCTACLDRFDRFPAMSIPVANL